MKIKDKLRKILLKSFKVSTKEKNNIKKLDDHKLLNLENFDSLMFVDFLLKLEKEFKIKIPVKFINNQLTINQLEKIINKNK